MMCADGVTVAPEPSIGEWPEASSMPGFDSQSAHEKVMKDRTKDGKHPSPMGPEDLLSLKKRGRPPLMYIRRNL